MKREKTEKNKEERRKSRNSVLLFMGFILIAQVTMGIFGRQITENGSTAVVAVDGMERYRYSLYVDRELQIDDTNTLVIKDGAADMISADCPDQICVKHSPISRAGESIICLPNKVVVTIESVTYKGKSARGEVDAVVK